MSSTARWIASLLGVALLVGVTGCSGGHATAKVSGKVTHDGQPVAGGILTFAPIAASSSAAAGKPATGEVKSDGTFVLSTYTAGDGAVVGRHKVTFFPAAPGNAEASAEPGKHDEAPPPSPYRGLMPKDPEVEVKSGSNEITIELVRDPNAAALVSPPK